MHRRLRIGLPVGEQDTDNLSGSYFVTLRRQLSLQATGVNPAILFRIKLCRFSRGFYLQRKIARERASCARSEEIGDIFEIYVPLGRYTLYITLQNKFESV